MTILVTGAAGFIGYHVCRALLDRGDAVVGIDNMNDYYDVSLKQARIAALADRSNFRFLEMDLADVAALPDRLGDGTKIRRVAHLAAQAGVRYSLSNPMAYVHSNLTGHVAVLEFCRHSDSVEHVVYASSSSVYGGNTSMPFRVEDRVDHPVSLYAATKKADELISHTYSHLFGLPQTGLRFFTVYGPWGRPDMAMWIFTEAIIAGRAIPVFNHGDMKRDFTYIDDIVAGVVGSLDHTASAEDGGAPHTVYNIGNNRSEELMRLIKVLETAIGKSAEIDFQPMQPGDVKETYADISAIQRDIGYAPTTPIDVGVPKFVEWYRDYHRL